MICMYLILTEISENLITPRAFSKTPLRHYYIRLFSKNVFPVPLLAQEGVIIHQ